MIGQFRGVGGWLGVAFCVKEMWESFLRYQDMYSDTKCPDYGEEVWT